MIVTVVGTGFVGVVTAAVLAKFGHRVYGLDVDERKIAELKKGQVPFYEPGLKELVEQGLANDNLVFTTDYKEAVEISKIVMVAVGTPSDKDGTADISSVLAVITSAAPHLREGVIVAIKSTVPPGTNERIREKLDELTDKEVFVASLPEFLREGSAVEDTLNPDRVVIGAGDEQVIEVLKELHGTMPGKRVIVSPESAQMAKYAANAYLAQRITFINQIADLCEKNGSRISEVIEAIGQDKRIGTHYWYPGLGYGGSCFPKDVRELAAYSRSVGEGDGLFVKIDELNHRRIEKKMAGYAKTVGGFDGKQVAVLGLSFKPNTNDMREAPSLKVVPWLIEHGARVRAYDPEAMEEAKGKLPEGITYADSVYQACDGAEVIVMLIEWDELVSMDLERVGKRAAGAWLIDTRNQFDRMKVEQAGMNYVGVGNG